jgi:hydroxymethylbilane synthase
MSGRALVLAAHGSRHVPQVNERILQLAEELRSRARLPFTSRSDVRGKEVATANDASDHPFDAKSAKSTKERAGFSGTLEYDTVAVALHQGAPAFAEVLDGLVENDITVVPIMTSRGYYADYVLPRELSRNQRFDQVALRITAPVGTHPAMLDLSERRIEQLCAQFVCDISKTAIAVVGHGTPRHERSRRATVNLASMLGYSGRFAQAFAVFLDDTPGLDAVARRATVDQVIVLPFLMGSGPHALWDIPERLGMIATATDLPRAERVEGRLTICDRPLGDDGGLIEIIADLAMGGPEGERLSAPLRPLRVGTRASKLALWQTEYVVEHFRNAGHELELIEISTLGDRVRDRAIHEIPSVAPFCGDIEHALGAGLIDLAVHSLKDVALHPAREFELAAILPRGDAREALVSRSGKTLAELPGGAIVGTSSPRRAAQVRATRPDLVVEPIRGPVDHRVQQVHHGSFEAAILALAGLQRLGVANEAAEIFALHRFVPAPAQGAMALQVRAGDETARALARTVDDTTTRIATTLELNVLRKLENEAHVTVAAHATVTDTIHLHLRLTTLDGGHTCDIVESGPNPAAVQRAVLANARTWLAELALEVRT